MDRYSPVTKAARNTGSTLGEKRNAKRYPVDMEARLRYPGGQAFEVAVIDMSLTGLACESLSRAHTGSRCWVTLPGLGSLESIVAHNSNGVMGCEFTRPLDMAVLQMFLSRYPAKTAK